MAVRSEKQRQASQKNGHRSRGPISQEGKAKSGQNARKHGLSGQEVHSGANFEPDLSELQSKLSQRFDANDPAQKQLVERVISSIYRMNKARALISVEFERLFSEPECQDASENKELGDFIIAQEKWIRENTGQKKVSIRLLLRLARDAGLDTKSRKLTQTKLTKLFRYAQRFRGERDSALKKLESLRSQQFQPNPMN